MNTQEKYAIEKAAKYYAENKYSPVPAFSQYDSSILQDFVKGIFIAGAEFALLELRKTSEEQSNNLTANNK